MIKKFSQRNNLGFTLIETIIYIGLFGIVFSGIFVSMYPLFTGAARLTNNVAAEGEAAFITAKINYLLRAGVTNSHSRITTPAEGTTGNELIITQDGAEMFRLTETFSSEYCVAPLLCHVLTLEENESGTALPLNTQRISVDHLKITHFAPSDGTPRHIDVSFTANGIPFGPIRYYLHF
jgi:type II secretory pathway pseudopilin PulG